MKRPERSPQPSKPPALKGWREWAARLGLVFFSPLLVVALAELALRLFGFGEPTSFFVKRSSGAEYITNDKFALQFAGNSTELRPFLSTLPVRKASGVLRVCILGESAAMGTPDPAFGFWRILQAQLKMMYPAHALEFVNAAMRGINSYAIRRIARECASYEVDLFVVYMGNNEVVGLHGPDPDTPGWKLSLPFIRTVEFVRRTRVGQLLELALPDGGSEEAQQNMDYFRAHRMRADDPRVEKVRANFQANLHDICESITGSGAKLLLCTVACNLRDCPPLGSLHRAALSAEEEARWDQGYEQGIKLQGQGQSAEALASYKLAADIDDHYAELQFRMAQCYSALRQFKEARERFVLARDWDALQFRTDSRLNEIIRAEGRLGGENVMLLDVEKAFLESDLCEDGVPGRRLFYEHAHPTFAGNYLLAKTCNEPVARLLGLEAGMEKGRSRPTVEECADYIGYTVYEDINVDAAMVRLTGGPPFLDQLNHDRRQAAAEAESKRRLLAFNLQDADRCIATHKTVIAREGSFWPARYNLGSLCLELKRLDEGTRELRTLCEMYPEEARFRIELGMALLRSGNKAGATSVLQEALRLRPRDRNLQQLLGQASVR